jgi:hypothetical protein
MKSVIDFRRCRAARGSTIAMAHRDRNDAGTRPGQSEWAPGQRATSAGGAKQFAPGQRMHQKDVKSQPGASEYAPGHLPNKDVKR